MGKILVIGSYVVAFWVKGPRIPKIGETIMGDHFGAGPGGKGSNQAITVARLGGDVALLAKVGRDHFGQDAMVLFEREGIDTGSIGIDEDTHTGAGIIFVDEAGRNSIGVAPGANYRLSEEDLEVQADLFEGASIVLIQLEIPLSTVEHAVGMAKAGGATVILNPAPAQKLSPELLGMVDILTPNETEAETLTGMPVANRSGAEAAASKLRSWGVGSVIVTLGEDGALLVSEEGARHFSGHVVKAVDTTGAGDAFNGGLAYGLASGRSIGGAVDFAAKVAALAVTKVGVVPALPRMEAVDSCFPGS